MGPDRFDLATAPLAGRVLVEASAGTGKTYSLAGLFLRLVAEAGLGVDQILVVTFTEAATEELRGRIRARLREALGALRRGQAGGDPVLAHLLGLEGEARERAPERLTAALRCFDEAAIFTIHGFCQRVLAERAFECGAPLGPELLPDPADLFTEVVADHWRRRLHGASPGLVRHLLGCGASLEALTRFSTAWSGRPRLEVQPALDPEAADPGPAEAAAREALGEVAARWADCRDEVLDLLATDRGLKHGKLSKDSVAKMGAALDGFLGAGDPLAPVKWIERFGRAFLEAETRPGAVTPHHPFLDTMQRLLASRDELEAAYRRAWIGFRLGLLEYVARELPARKARQGVRTFDDLLGEVHRALAAPGGERLAVALRDRYRAALIDEFQDTDPLQYGIFQRVFGAAAEPRLTLIGDPKQAIYGFRGADLFAYLGAANAIQRRYTLGQNWRSTPRLLAAVEHLFTRGPRPFALEGVGFVPVEPGGGGKPPLVLGDQPDPPALELWRIDPGEDGKPPGKTRLTRELCRSAAGEVLRLLEEGAAGRATIDGRSLEPGDVAVLVRSNLQARQVQRALGRLRIPSVIASAESLFATPEARQVLQLLAAVAEPGHPGRARAALATELVGLTAAELWTLGEDERRWDRWLERFDRWHRLWGERGVVAALRTALAELEVRGRLLAEPDGERRVTDLLHLVEVLQDAAAAGRLGPEALVAWLARRLADPEETEAYQLRLETDERAVQVVTVHKAKGLEYPVVLCPFLWAGLKPLPKPPKTREEEVERLGRREPVSCHLPEDPSRLVLDLGGAAYERHRALARWEGLAEELRVAYVALTRARQRCVLAWGATNQGESAALGYLLHGSAAVRAAAPEELVAALEAESPQARSRYAEELEALAAGSGGSVAVGPVPPPAPDGAAYRAGEEAPETLARRDPPGEIPRDWGVTSYSGLVAGAEAGGGRAERPDRDQHTASPGAAADPGAPPSPGADLFGFPRGARAGTCLHAVLEHLEFPEAAGGALAAEVEGQLAAHGFHPGWAPAVAAGLDRVLDAPLLAPPLPGDPGFALRGLAQADRLTELEFHLPLGRVQPRGLARCLAAAPGLPEGLAERAGRLGFRPLRGLLKGFVDLVFRSGNRVYLLDWKSNHLGDRAEQYGPAALEAAMAGHNYDLQALLYTVALHRYLALRQPGYRYAEHLGGAVYVFLRGVDGRPERGLARLRFPEAAVAAVAGYLAAGGDG